MQEKIPQEMNVEDKIIGPFTLKQFGFVFVAALVMVIFMVIFMNLGLSTLPAMIVGAFFGSFSLILCFVPYNGRPLYVFTLPFFSFLSKPKQRTWKRVAETTKDTAFVKQDTPKIPEETIVEPLPQKGSLESAESEIEKASLLVDTGGAYGLPKKIHEAEPIDIFDKSTPSVDNALSQKSTEQVGESPKIESPISEMATVDPEKKFAYEYPDTSKYKIDEAVESIGEEGTEVETEGETEGESEIKRF